MVNALQKAYFYNYLFSHSLSPKDITYKVISVIDLCISTFFIAEVAMRMYAMTPKWYFSKRYWFNSLDFVIVLIGFLGSLIEIILINRKCADGKVKSVL